MKKSAGLFFVCITSLFLILTIPSCKLGLTNDNPTPEQNENQPDTNKDNNVTDPESIIDVYVPQRTSLPASDDPVVIQDTDTRIAQGEEGFAVGTSVSSISVYNGSPILTVTPRTDGLLIQKNHDPEWVHINIRIEDIEHNRRNASIVTDPNHNEFLYPFVNKGKSYKIFL